MPRSTTRVTTPFHSAVAGAGHLRVSVLVRLPEVLRELGADPNAVIAEAGVDPALLRDPENTLAFRSVGALLEHCAQRTDCARLGLLVGQRAEEQALGVIGLLMQHAPSVEEALQGVIRHLHLHDQGGVASLDRSGEFARLAYGICEHDVHGREQIYAGSLAHMFHLMRGLCGPQWLPVEAHFPFRRPRDPAPFRSFFRARLRFDAEDCALVFHSRWLQQRMPGANPQLHRAVETLVNRLEGRAGGSVVPAMRRTLRAMLIAGHASEGRVAQAFAVHRRTLNRRLRDEGTTFRSLLNEARYEVACQLLGDSDAGVEEIAGGLGYSGATAFGRAFKRWSGRAPQVWRAAALCGASIGTGAR